MASTKVQSRPVLYSIDCALGLFPMGPTTFDPGDSLDRVHWWVAFGARSVLALPGGGQKTGQERDRNRILDRTGRTVWYPAASAQE